jgi:type I restriction enzyme S subunit
MVYSKELKREIPEGWEIDSLWNIATYFNGLAMQKHRPTNDNKLRVIKIKEMNEGFGDYTEYAKADVLKEAIINNGDILFSWSASLDVIIWDKGIGALNQHIFKVSSKKYPRSFYYYELINYLKHFKMMADLRKTTMGHITQEHLKQSKIVIPPIHLIIALDSKINIFIEKQILLQQQNQELAKLRDWLLPMLMNGQVRIK